MGPLPRQMVVLAEANTQPCEPVLESGLKEPSVASRREFLLIASLMERLSSSILSGKGPSILL